MRKKSKRKKQTQRYYLKDVIWWQTHGPIPPGFKVSHRNGLTFDNRRQNLYLVPEAEYPGDEGQIFTTEDLSHLRPLFSSN